MTIEGECFIDKINAANQEQKAAINTTEAIELIKDSVEKSLGEFTVSCERCGACFAISTDEIDQPRLFLEAQPNEQDEVCDQTKYKKTGDWIGNMYSRWFNVAWIHKNESPEDRARYDSEKPELSPYGLEIILDTAAKNVAKPLDSADQTIRSADIALILDSTLIRPDGKTFEEVIIERAAKLI